MIYHSTRLDRTVVLILLRALVMVCTLDQKTSTTNETNAACEKCICITLRKSYGVIFLLAVYGSSAQRKRKLMAYYGILRKF